MPGQQLQVQAPNGTVLAVTVPQGAMPGSTIKVAYSQPQVALAQVVQPVQQQPVAASIPYNAVQVSQVNSAYSTGATVQPVHVPYSAATAQPTYNAIPYKP